MLGVESYSPANVIDQISDCCHFLFLQKKQDPLLGRQALA
jgi:hypothetical protein